MDGDWFEASDVRAMLTVETRRHRAEDELALRMHRVGAAALSDDELLAALGVETDSVLRPLLRHGLPHLFETPELAYEVAPLLTTRLLAAVELARRIPAKKSERPRLFSPSAIAQWARTQLVQHRLEETWVLSLNARNVLLRFDRIGTGGVDHCVVDPREALAPAVACRASGIVLLHTHPGGDPEPSAQDLSLTRRLKLAASHLHVALLDHLVLCDARYLSMAERGLLDAGRGEPVLRRPLSPPSGSFSPPSRSLLADEDD